VALIELVYVAGANYFLSSGQVQSLINTRPEKLKLDFSKAWTLLPGLVHLEGFSVEGVEGKLQWHAELSSANVMVDLTGLATRNFRTYLVRADGGLFRLTRRAPLEEDSLKQASKQASKKAPWWIRLGGLSLEHFNEITILDYSYQGEGFIGGAFELWPGRTLEVSDAEIDFKGGKVLLGERTLSEKLVGSIDAAINEWKPREKSPSEILDGMDAEIRLKGVLAEADFLNHYLESIRWLKISGVSGDFSVAARVEDGSFASPSQASIVARKMGAGVYRYKAEGVGHADWLLDTAGESPLMKMRLSLDDYIVTDKVNREVIAQGPQLKILADSYDLSLRKMFSDISDLNATIELDKVSLTDLRFVNTFLPVSKHFEVLEGAADFEARLNVSTRRASQPGFCKVEGRGAKARFRQTQLSGDFGFTAVIEDTEKGADKFKVSGSRIAFTQVQVIESNKKKKAKPRPPWSGELSLNEAWVEPQEQIVFHGQTALALDDAGPVLSILSNTSRIARIVSSLADMTKLRGESDFRIGKDFIEFTNLRLRSSDVDLRANLRLLDENTQALALIEYGVLQIGVEVKGEKTDTKLTQARPWFERKLPWKP